MNEYSQYSQSAIEGGEEATTVLIAVVLGLSGFVYFLA